MGKCYDQLSHHERRLIYQWHHCGTKSIREIGRLLKRSHATISREIKRNKSYYYIPTWYPNIAQDKYLMRIRKRGRRPRLKNEITRDYVINKLKIGWTPEIIAGRSRLETEIAYVCHEAIYQFIYKESPDLIQLLPRKHKKRRKKYPQRGTRSNIKNKVSIEDRPQQVADRTEVGHWESDSIVSPKQKPGLNVAVERVTRLVHISKLASKSAKSTHISLVQKLSQHPEDFIKSITYDNGSENAKHIETNEALNCKSYFCLPYHSWEKGAVEQVNGLIRRFLPKKTDLTEISKTTIKQIERQLNDRPRKCLNYKTPNEAYRDLYGKMPET